MIMTLRPGERRVLQPEAVERPRAEGPAEPRAAEARAVAGPAASEQVAVLRGAVAAEDWVEPAVLAVRGRAEPREMVEPAVPAVFRGLLEPPEVVAALTQKTLARQTSSMRRGRLVRKH